jgi:hypothetical protein
MADGLTLAEYAAAKQLPADFLRQLGVSDVTLNQTSTVRIPYYDADGTVIATRLRIALVGDRFRWARTSKTAPYGLSRLGDARTQGFVVLVEGESDAQTLWHHGVPALGIPGAATWKPEWDAALIGIDIIYVVLEPDTGGEAVMRWLAEQSWRDKVRLIRLDGAKDVSELHLATPDTFNATFQAALDAAAPYLGVADAQERDEEAEAWGVCASLASSPRILPIVVTAVRSLGVVRERGAIKLVFLAVVSRLLEKPVSVALKGPSAAGKSHLVEQVLRLVPPSAAYVLSAMSERALAYSQEPLSHRMLVLYEAAGLHSDFASYLVRTLLSEGCLKYETVEKTAKGMKARLIVREGPTGLIVTTTLVRLHPENETRLLSVPVTDTNEQTAAVLRSFAGDDLPPVDLAPWHALQEWLAFGETRVVIPYARALTRLIPPVAVRLRRDVLQVLTLIRAHALLHRATRAVDSQGRIVAIPADYVAVRRLVEPLVSAGVGATVPRTVRQVVAAVESYKKDDVTIREVADALGLDKSAAWRRVQGALADGYLKNDEDRRGRPARLKVGAAMPDDAPVLPSQRRLLHEIERLHAEDAAREGGSIPPQERVQPCNHPQDGVNGTGCTVAGVLGGVSTPPPPPDDEHEPGWDG